MRFTRIAITGSLALAAGVMTTALAQNAPQPQPAPAQPGPAAATHIGVIDPQVVLDSMQEMKDIKAAFRQQQQEQESAENAKKAEIGQLEESRNKNLKPDSKQYNEASQTIDQKKADLQAWDTLTRLRDDREQKQTLKNLYKEIQDASARIAQEDGLDLVITTIDQDIPSVENMTNDQLHLLLDERVVMYHSPKIDVTQKVLTRLDLDYANRKAGGAGQAGLPPGTGGAGGAGGQ